MTTESTLRNEETVPLTQRIPSKDESTEKRGWIDEISPEIEQYLHTPPTYGLDAEQVAARLERFGRNELVEKKKNKVLHFLSFFTGPIAYLMELSVILTAIIGDWPDFGIILGLLIVNALIGFIEESRAESAVHALKNTLALQTQCWRSGQLIQLKAADLVVGDVIVLRLGDIVPADARLLGLSVSGDPAPTDLHVDQSALTGESLLVTKRAGDLVYSSCTIKQGQQLAVVVRTGPETFIGRAARLITVTTDAGHFQKVINYIGNFLILITLLLVSILLAYDLIELRVRNGAVSGTDVLNTLQEMVVLTIAAIPVGLPTIMSVTMAVGAKQLAKKQVIVKRLTAVEELSSVSILCTDKTGTLTLNELTFDEPYLTPGYTKDDIVLYAYLASEPAPNDPIEYAVRHAAEQTHPHVTPHDIHGYKVISFTPFNPNDKYSQATVEQLGTQETFKVAKGAPHIILGLVGGDEKAESMVEELASRGLRALGVARTRSSAAGGGWELVGLFSMIDPPRHDSALTLEECSRYGLTVKMITGDESAIAREVATRLGMGDNFVDVEYLVDGSKSEQDIAELCLRADGFARVIPEHKFKIIELLQNTGHRVAMTGDGVNDAAALKKANVGIAVHGSTDAARSAADIVLLTPGLLPIIDGIKVSRVIFQRLQSYALYRITSTVHFLLFFFVVTIAADWAMPPILLIIISVLNDAATLIMAVDNVSISPTPDKWQLRQLIFLSVMLALLLCGFSFAHFYIFRDVIQIEPSKLATVMYLHISSAPHFVIFSTRIQGFWWTNIPSWPFTVVVLGTQIIALVLSVYGFFGYDARIGEIGWVLGVIILAISLATFIIVDLFKVFLIRIWNKYFNKRAREEPMPLKPAKSGKTTTRAARFMQQQQERSRMGYDRAQRRDSNSSVVSF